MSQIQKRNTRDDIANEQLLAFDGYAIAEPTNTGKSQCGFCGQKCQVDEDIINPYHPNILCLTCVIRRDALIAMSTNFGFEDYL